MKTISKILMGLLLGFGLVATSMGPALAGCKLQCFSACCLWLPDPWPGTGYCTDDPQTYPGEVTYHTGNNLAGECAYHGNTPVTFNSIGEYDDRIYSVENKSPHTVYLYQHPNLGGALLATIAPNTWANVPAGTSSIRIQ